MEDLNSEQKQAAMHLDGPMLVLAGAGSGKTRVVTHRIAHLLSVGVPASEIVALTFTNKAAQEMRERIRRVSDQIVLTCTFHSLCARILRESIHHLGFDRNFSIYDQSDSDQLIKTCLKGLGYKEDRAFVKGIKQAISQAKNDLVTPSDLGDESLTTADKAFKAVYTLYQQKLKEYNAVDFDDLLFLTVKLFITKKDILKEYQHRWSFILIDEYQDTNMAQYKLTKFLGGERQNIFVVGDPDQSIYSWRGANIDNILNFEKDFPGAQIVSLEQNYRSTTHILEGANALIECNTERYKKNLWSDLGEGEKIGHYIAPNERDETHFVVKRLLEHHRHQGIPLKESVIFYRTNSQSRVVEDALLKYQIPYIIIGGLSFYQRREIKDILAYLRLALSKSDFLSFARTINLPRRGFGATTLDKLRLAAEQGAPFPFIDLIRKSPPCR